MAAGLLIRDTEYFHIKPVHNSPLTAANYAIDAYTSSAYSCLMVIIETKVFTKIINALMPDDHSTGSYS